MEDLKRQLVELRERVERLEARIGASDTQRPAVDAAPSRPATAPGPEDGPGRSLADKVAAATTGSLPTPGATTLMATGAAAAFILAAVYFIKLVYDAGWLTPERQLVLAVSAGAALIAAGLWLARHDRGYAAFLPAPGVVILYMTFYAGHLWYEMLDARFVLGAIGVTTLVAIGLDQHFRHSLYALVAVAGAYSFPVLLPSQSPQLLEVVVYFAAWGLLFSWLSIQEGRRTIYLLALWLAVTGFDIAWRISAADQMWQLAAGYHFAQFLLFAVTAVVFSVRHRSPMSSLQTLVHGGALFYFYGIEYILIRSHAERAAPLIALASVAVVLVLFQIARSTLPQSARPEASAVLVSAYASIVTTHVVLFELLPEEYFPWAALLLPLLPGALAPALREYPSMLVPMRILTGLLFGVSLLVLIGADPLRTEIPLPRLALFLYTAMLYVGAWLQLRDLGRHQKPPLLLYAGHLTFMVAAVKAFDSELTVSISWGLFAVALLMVALQSRDRVLGASALLVFAAFALKVLMVDLTGSPSLVRVGTLIVLGGSLYVGGWLYQRIAEPNPES